MLLKQQQQQYKILDILIVISLSNLGLLHTDGNKIKLSLHKHSTTTHTNLYYVCTSHTYMASVCLQINTAQYLFFADLLHHILEIE